MVPYNGSLAFYPYNDLNKMPENDDTIDSNSTIKVKLRDDFEFDLNKLSYNGFLDGPTFENASEASKQFTWKWFKLWCPILDR